MALSRCHEVLRTWQLAHDDSEHNGQDDSLKFHCQSLLRLSYLRVSSGRRYFNRTTLLLENENGLEKAVRTYVSTPQDRSQVLTKAAGQVMFCSTAPVRAGHMLVRKTAAFTWSIEHTIAS